MGKITAWYELLIHTERLKQAGRLQWEEWHEVRPSLSFNSSVGKCNSVMGTGSNVTAGPDQRHLPLPHMLAVASCPSVETRRRNRRAYVYTPVRFHLSWPDLMPGALIINCLRTGDRKVSTNEAAASHGIHGRLGVSEQEWKFHTLNQSPSIQSEKSEKQIVSFSNKTTQNLLVHSSLSWNTAPAVKRLLVWF